MRRNAVLALVLGVLTGAAALFVAAPGQAAAPTRIMALGDSITGSPGCRRALLDRDLRAAGHAAIDFVGTLAPQGCGFPHDGENEGHSGYLATNVADQDLLPGWLARTTPDVVLMHFGTNDVWSNRSPAAILAAFGKLVDVTATNRGTAPSTGWSVRFGLAAGMSVGQAWNGVTSQSGTTLTVGNVEWNGRLTPSASATAGMIVNGDPTGWTPAPVCTLS